VWASCVIITAIGSAGRSAIRTITQHSQHPRSPSSLRPPPSYPAHAGYPVRRGLSIQSPTSLEYGIVRFRGRRQLKMCGVRATKDTPERHASILRGVVRPRFCRTLSPFIEEGAGNAGCPMHPQPHARYGVVEYAHEYSQRKHRKHPASPTQWFYGLLRALPGDQLLFLTPSSARRFRVVANLTPAKGRQNHTTSPSAKQRARQSRCSRPPHPVQRS